jgi:hypothetical protein
MADEHHRACYSIANPRSAWAAIPAALLLAAAVSGCGGSGAPPALTVRCVGRTLPAPDTSGSATGTDSRFEVLPLPVTVVTGVPHQSGTMPTSGLPLTPDPDTADVG